MFSALAGSRDPDAKGREQEQGRARERQHMRTAEVTKAADLSRAGGTRRGERSGREAKCTVRNRKKEKKKKTGGECGIWRGEIKQNLHGL